MIHVSVGSNIDPDIHVPSAIARLCGMLDVAAISPFYQVPALDRPEQADYWNGVIAISHEGPGLADQLREIEAAEGRIRTKDKWAARTLDLDILLDGGRIVDGDLHSRPFLARCLADLGALPDGIPDPGQHWPVVWGREAQH